MASKSEALRAGELFGNALGFLVFLPSLWVWSLVFAGGQTGRKDGQKGVCDDRAFKIQGFFADCDSLSQLW